jgi:hypothetical protein
MMLAASMTAFSEAAVIVTPGPPPDPQNYIHLSLHWSFTPPPSITLFGGAENNPLLVADSVWYPRNSPQNPQLRQLSFQLEDPNVAGAEAFTAQLGPELDSGLPEFNLFIGEILSSKQIANTLASVRRLTFTAPGGYFRQTPEPSAILLAACAAAVLPKRRR